MARSEDSQPSREKDPKRDAIARAFEAAGSASAQDKKTELADAGFATCPSCFAEIQMDPEVPSTGYACGECGNIHNQTPAHDDQLVGTSVDGYKLLQKIGEGGMGAVYMAEQTEPVERRVAIKIIKPGMDSRQVIARFEAERQALAMMDHPNIARVLDAGTTQQQRPYFIMELVKGVPITNYCDAQRLSPHERLELLIPVCRAVQHAHQKGIIHRDLKPSNILIALYDGQPVPKVIDFGVAKATAGKLTDKTMFTQLGQVVGTFEYMSPEQAQLNQLDIDTRSDIYSLGTVLYEMLTGTTPFGAARLRSAALDEVIRIIRDEEPPKPSTRVSTTKNIATIAERRHVDPSRLSALMRGELDWIVMKALDKDRSRRYETANGLALDIQRYLDDEPVLACPPGKRYLLRKFIRKNRIAVITCGLIVATMMTGLALATWGFFTAREATAEAVEQRDEAVRQRQRTREALDTMLSPTGLRWLTTQQELLPEQKAFLETALVWYREFAAEEGDEAQARRLAAMANVRVGDILTALDQFEEANEPLENGVTQFRELLNENPEDEHTQLGLIDALASLVSHYTRAGSFARHHDVAHAANERMQRLLVSRPDDQRLRRMLINNFNLLGESVRGQGDLKQSRQAWEAALEHWDILLEQNADSASYKLGKSYYLNRLGHVLDELGHSDRSHEAYDLAAALAEQAAEAADLGKMDRSRLIGIYDTLLRNYRRLRKFDKAIKAGQRLVELREETVSRFPSNPGARFGGSYSWMYLAYAYAETNSWMDAEAAFRRSFELIDKLYRDSPSNNLYRDKWLSSALGLASALDQLQRFDEADQLWQQLSELEDPELKRAVLQEKAMSRGRAGRVEESLELVEQLPDWNHLELFSLYNLACTFSLCVKATDDPERKRRLTQRAVDAIEMATKKGFRDREMADADHDLDHIRDSDAFQELMNTWSEKSPEQPSPK